MFCYEVRAETLPIRAKNKYVICIKAISRKAYKERVRLV